MKNEKKTAQKIFMSMCGLVVSVFSLKKVS